jgi:lipoic acid synthetase
VKSKFPSWLKTRVRVGGQDYAALQNVLRGAQLHTVCESARCPNAHDCFTRGTATFLIMGDRCTRNCRFCAVPHAPPDPPDPREPGRVARMAARLGLRHVVITSVTRDDLPDGGARWFAAVIRAVRRQLPEATIEVLTPDFQGERAPLRKVLAAGPDVFNHNLETVRRLQLTIRPQADYDRSLSVLKMAREMGKGRIRVKSGLMVGLGETDAEIRGALDDLRAAGCEWLTLGQYLAPSDAHAPVKRYVTPRTFTRYAQWARERGFTAVASGPLVRSSFHAAEMMADG